MRSRWLLSFATIVNHCGTADSRERVTAAKNYGVWSVGLELRLAL